jgi:hypothetical protein
MVFLCLFFMLVELNYDKEGGKGEKERNGGEKRKRWGGEEGTGG